MFLFKKIVALFLSPLSLSLALLLVGLGFLWFSRRQRAGKILVSAGVGLLLRVPGGGFQEDIPGINSHNLGHLGRNLGLGDLIK